MEYDEQREIRTIPISSHKTYKNKTEPGLLNDQELYRSNSANDLLNLKENKKKTKTERIKKRNPNFHRTSSAKSYFDHYDLNNCEHCQGIDKLLKKDKSKLSSFIEKNPSFLKLFGNPRYDRNSPFLFVEDHKNKIDDDRIGLLPIPTKPKIIMKSKDENNKLYEMQRKIVMMRRFQYGKKFNEEVNNNAGEDFFEKIQKIQNWWKKLYKIIYIQKIFRGFRIRKRVNFIVNFIEVINRWQRILDNIKARRVLRDLINNKAKILPNKNNIKGYDYMSKVRRTGKSFLNNIYDNMKKNNYNNNNYKNFLNKGKKQNRNEQPNKYPNFSNDSKNNNDDEKNNDSDQNDNNRYNGGNKGKNNIPNNNRYNNGDKKNNNNDKDKIFNVGIENLMEKDEGIYETVDELMDQEQYFECFDLISYYLCEKKFNKQGKFGYFKNFMSGGLTNFLRTDNIKDDENNNNIGEENMENNKD